MAMPKISVSGALIKFHILHFLILFNFFFIGVVFGIIHF